MKQIIKAIKRFLEWVRFWLWYKPIEKPVPDTPYKLKATEVAKEYMVVTYHGQRINMHVLQYPIWKASSRKDKRAMRDKFAKLEKQGKIIFQEVEGKLVAIKNKTYGDEKNAK